MIYKIYLSFAIFALLNTSYIYIYIYIYIFLRLYIFLCIYTIPLILKKLKFRPCRAMGLALFLDQLD
ncbi:hypothetical protein K6L59_02865, partial [Candidatus Phytoplasma sp. Tabriz.2]|nr:hypothetical protein [Candidatus Phytoplasma australiense]